MRSRTTRLQILVLHDLQGLGSLTTIWWHLSDAWDKSSLIQILYITVIDIIMIKQRNLKISILSKYNYLILLFQIISLMSARAFPKRGKRVEKSSFRPYFIIYKVSIAYLVLYRSPKIASRQLSSKVADALEESLYIIINIRAD